MKEIIAKIKQYIIQNQIDRGLDILLECGNLGEEIEKTLILMFRELNELKIDERKGVIDKENYRTGKGKLASRLLDIIGDLNDSKLVENASKNLCPKKAQESFSNESKLGYLFKDFYIGERRVSIFTPDMTVAELYQILPRRQIKKVVLQGEFAEDLYDAYEISDLDSSLLLTITAEERKGLRAKLRSCTIQSDKFKDVFNKMYIGAMLGDVRGVHTISRASPTINHVILHIDYLPIDISVSKLQLEGVNRWKEGVVLKNLPNNLIVEGLFIHWKK